LRSESRTVFLYWLPSHAREHAGGGRSPREGGARLAQRSEQGAGEGRPHYTDRGTLYQRADGTRLETFTYDALGNLTRVERNGGPDIDYEIDAQGRRVAKRIDGTMSKQYIWSGGLRIAAELQGGEVVSRFIYGNGLTTPDLIVRLGGTTGPDRLYRVISDHLGSPIYIVNLADPSDVWVDASYDEWGNITSFQLDGVDQGEDTSAWPIPQGFAGGLYDADTGLVRFGARDYDARVGRWTAKDPILFEGGQGNLYVYVGNEPIGHFDPLGLKDWTDAETQVLLENYSGFLRSSSSSYLLMADLHRGGGVFDFVSSPDMYEDTFTLDGYGTMDAAQFGNFIAGYAAGVLDDPLAYWLVRATGSMYGLGAGLWGHAPPGEWQYFGDNADSVTHIDRGAGYARRVECD